MLLLYKLTDEAKDSTIDFRPIRGSEHAAGYDLRACISSDVAILPSEIVKIPTGVKLDLLTMSLANGLTTQALFTGFIYPRSGLGTKGFTLANTVGVIDADYQGELIIMGFNRSEDIITIKAGDRIAQLVITMAAIPVFSLVEEFDSYTTRGSDGFGSTGV
jgi:dUTP pyrophosphatase